MGRCTRLLTAAIVFCFMAVCLSPVKAYALQQESASGSGRPDASAPAAGGTSPQTTGQAIGTTGQAIDAGDGDGNQKEDPDEQGDINGLPVDPGGQGTDSGGKEAAPQPEDDESLWYRKAVPMKKDHQKLLWDYCQKRKLDYIDMLALIYTESNFDEKCTTGKYYGYFQLSKGNCANLAATLKTKNKPLDGAININWGTAMFGWILEDKRVKGLEGKKKRDVALSIYQRGTGGYDKSGISTGFLKIFYKKRSIVCGWFGLEQ